MPDVQVAGDGRELVLFLHGSWVHAGSWTPWGELFDDSGYDSIALRWPREQIHRDDPPSPLRPTPADLTRLVQAAVASTDRAPILIGHGIGGLVAHTLIGRVPLAAAIAVAPAPFGLRSTVPALLPGDALRERAVTGGRRVPSPSAGDFHRYYANTLDRSEAAGLHHRLAVPARARGRLRAPGRPGTSRSPLLLVSGGKDVLAPESGVRALARRNRRRYPDDITDHQVFPDRAHCLAVDARWHDVAYYCLDWLTRQNL